MSGESDDEFEMTRTASCPCRGDAKGKRKGKCKATSKPKSSKADSFSLDSLLAQSEMDIERKDKIAVGLDMSAVERITNHEFDIERDKQQLYAENARAEKQEAQIMANESITIPGTIRVFEPKEAKLTSLQFDLPCPSHDLAVLFEALRRSAENPDDLEEIFRGALVPWVRQKLDGKAPPQVCRWIVRLIAWHVSPRLVLAAEEVLLHLLDEPNNDWRLRYEDSLEVWRACGAVWLASDQTDEKVDARGRFPRSFKGKVAGEGGGANGEPDVKRERGEKADMDEDNEDDNEDDEKDYEEDDEESAVRRNLGSFLNIVEACLRRGAHELSDAELQEMLLDLLSAALDEGVCGSCQTEVYRTLQAVADAMPRELYERSGACSALVDRICDPAARRLGFRMEKLSIVLLARNVPLSRGAVDGVRGDRGISLRHEEVQKAEGFSRGLKAMEVVLNDEDDILEDDTLGGYERQFGVVALVNEMCAGALAVSATGRPEPGECREMLSMLGSMDEHLTNVMQRPVQMSKTLLSLMKSKLTPFAKESPRRQGSLSPFVEESEGMATKSGDTSSHMGGGDDKLEPDADEDGHQDDDEDEDGDFDMGRF